VTSGSAGWGANLIIIGENVEVDVAEGIDADVLATASAEGI